MEIDGSRRRRKGLALETDGSVLTVDETETGVVRAHHWRNVGGDPTFNFMVLQIGSGLYFLKDNITVTSNFLGYIDLTSYKTDTATDANVAASFVNTDYGRGHLFVVGSYIDPLYIEYDATADEFTITRIDIEERDFEGIDDGISNTAKPDSAVSSHIYNLKNSGWLPDYIDDFVADQGVYPSKNMIPWMGMARGDTSNVAEQDWTKSFSPDKLVAELFQDMPAPRGHFIRSAWNPAFVIGDGTSYNISTWYLTAVDGGSETMHVRLDADHTLITGDDVAIDGHNAIYKKYFMSFLGREIYSNESWSADGYYDITVTGRTVSAATAANPIVITTSADHGYQTGDRVKFASMPGDFGTNLNGNTYAITKVDANEFSIAVNGVGWTAYTSGGTVTPANFFDITVTIPDMSYGWTDQFNKLGSVWLSYDETTASVVDRRPTTVAFYAGRVWYAGIVDAELSSKVYFSQIIETESQYGKCYQQADPTSEHISDLVASDGGVINIPEMDTVRELLPYNGKLLVFADNGVWEIGGGERGYFTAVGYSLRQITNVGCSSGMSVIVAEGTPYFWSDGAIYAILQDPYQGFLFAKDISTGKIQSLLKMIPKAQKQLVQASYDRNSQRIYWLYDTASVPAYKYPYWIVMDIRLDNGFSKHVNKGALHIRTLYDIEDYQAASAEERNIKFVCDNTNRDEVTVSELNDTSFEDFGVDAAAFVETGNDGMGNITRRHYGRYLFTYMERTETESDENVSECYVQYLWNWADSAVHGAWSNPRSIYRRWMWKYRETLPGEPVVTAKSKIRGSGKVLKLRFHTEAGKPCHLYGWQVEQDIGAEA